MNFVPFKLMKKRLDVTRSDSDTAVFHDLMYFGEMVVKVTVGGLVAAIKDESDRCRYRQLYRIIRADGLGEWCAVVEDVLTGPPAQHLAAEVRETSRSLNQRVGADTWQFRCISLLSDCLRWIHRDREVLPSRLSGKRWLADFCVLRNSTRGHGALPPRLASKLAPLLEQSIDLFCQNLPLLKMPWAFLHQNLSGRYRVSPMTDSTAPFDYLKKARDAPVFSDGVYVHYDRPCLVELIQSDADLSDFFFPNGGFNGKRYELLSYITDTRIFQDAVPYLIPAEGLPPSETQGLGQLEICGDCFGNLPPLAQGYVRRNGLEDELRERLLEEHHPLITLHGPGGIGKTSLALAVLHQIAKETRFQIILWFSARDIELLEEGPKPVQAHMLTARDVAEEYVRLLEPKEFGAKGFKSQDYFARNLTKNDWESALFVFDNFETVQDPIDFYQWIDAHVRSPNKVLITTRSRHFKGDYPVAVPGMTRPEADRLIDEVSRRLRIAGLVTEEYRQEIYRESDGHPYVIKILLGEVVKAGRRVKVIRIVAEKTRVLTALFERTYQSLSRTARRVFLTLCNWRSVVPLVGLKAVLLRPANERMDVDAAVEELEQSSFVELVPSDEDEQSFVHIPLPASEFGRRKIQVDPMKAAVEADCSLLQAFGAAQTSDVRHGVAPRIKRLVRYVSRELSSERGDPGQYQAILQFVAENHHPTWLLLADLHEERQEHDKAKDAIQRYLEATEGRPDDVRADAWGRLAGLARTANIPLDEIHALVEMCQDPNIPYWKASNAACRLNTIFRERPAHLDREEKKILVRKLVAVMEERLDEADATDLSRLAWLCLNLGDEGRASEYTKRGLDQDPQNQHCGKLADRLRL